MACDSLKAQTILTNIRQQRTIGMRPDETIAALGGGYDDASLMNLTSGVQLKAYKGPVEKSQNPIQSLGISPDHQVLVTANIEGRTNFWNISSGEQIHTLTTQDFVTDMAFNPDGSRLALISATLLQVVTLADYHIQQAGSVSPGKVNSISFSPDGKWMATGYATGPIRLWSTDSWQEIPLKLEDNSEGGKVLFSPNGAYLAATNLNSVRVWELSSEKMVLKSESGSQKFLCATFSPDSIHLAIGTQEEQQNGDPKNFQAGIQIWDVETGQLINTMVGHPYANNGVVGNWVNALAFTPDGGTLASGGFLESKIRLWDVNTGQQTGVIAQHFGGIYRILFSADQSILVSSSVDKTVRLWDLANKKTLQTLNIPEADWYTDIPLALSPNGELIVAATWNNMTVRIWQLKDGKQVFDQMLTTRPYYGFNEMAVAFSPDGGLLAVGGWDGRLRIYGLPPDS